MSGKKIKVPLSSDGISVLIREVEKYKKWIETKTQEFINRLAQEGLNIASAKFSQAQYDGSNDVSVSVEKRGSDCVAVVAVGAAALFIEFGTGIIYPDNHPEAAEHGMRRGNYGHKLGRLKKGWRYTGDPGTHGEVILSGKHTGEVKTKGNPANMPMYSSVRELEDKFAEIAKEVFKAGD